MSMRFTLLGTGSSGGVPRVGPVWGSCDPANPKNRRRRCALLVDRFGQGGRTTALVDTPADLREQLLDAGVATLDGVLFTHDHADHTHGIDDLRGVFFNTKRRVRVWADAATRAALEARFDYCFLQKAGSLYPAILQAHDIRPPEPVRIEGRGGTIEAVPILQQHGDAPRSVSASAMSPIRPTSAAFQRARYPCCRGSTCGSSMPCVRCRIRATSRCGRLSPGSSASA